MTGPSRDVALRVANVDTEAARRVVARATRIGLWARPPTAWTLTDAEMCWRDAWPAHRRGGGGDRPDDEHLPVVA